MAQRTFSNSWLDTLDNMTMAASHELAESVTDPNIGVGAIGWNDETSNPEGEVGDIVNSSTVYLNGYAVQRIADPNDQAMTPMGATSATPVDFVLVPNGTLWVRDQSGFTEQAGGVASISDQGVDNFGQAMVDVVYTNGSAAEWHEGLLTAGGDPGTFVTGTHWVSLGSNVKEAKAGQGVSYVLSTNGGLDEHTDPNPNANNFSNNSLLDRNVQSIDAGTDQHGVNMVTEVRTDSFTELIFNGLVPRILHYTQSDGYESSDSFSGVRQIDLVASNVESLSAGKQGNIAYVAAGGLAYSYSESTGLSTYLGSGVAAVTAGTDQNGNLVLDMLFANGNLEEWRPASGWTSLASNVASIGKAHAGVLDVVFSSGEAETVSNGNWNFLTSNATTAA